MSSTSRILTAGVCITSLIFGPTPSDADDIVIRAKHVLTMSGDVLSPGMLRIQDGRIAEIAESFDAGDARVVEIDTVMPGLIDAYSQTGLGSNDDEFTLEITPDFRIADIIDWRSRDVRLQRADGIAIAHITPGSDNVIGGISCIARLSEPNQSGERFLSRDKALFFAVCNDPTARNFSRSRPESIFVRQPTNRMGVVWMLRNVLHQAKTPLADGAEIVTDQNTVDPAVIREALEAKRPIFALSRTHYDTRSLLTLGKEFGFRPVVVGGHEAWKILDELAAAETSVVLTGNPPGDLTGFEGTRLCANNAGRLADKGIPFCLANGSLLDQARFAVRFGLSREAALAAVTTSPAKIIGIDDVAGTLEVGRPAHIVGLSGHPLEFTSAVRWLMIDGVLQDQD